MLNILPFYPQKLGKMSSNLTSILFPMGWNHQMAKHQWNHTTSSSNHQQIVNQKYTTWHFDDSPWVPMTSIFEGQPPQNKAFSNENKGHLGSRLCYLPTLTITPSQANLKLSVHRNQNSPENHEKWIHPFLEKEERIYIYLYPTQPEVFWAGCSRSKKGYVFLMYLTLLDFFRIFTEVSRFPPRANQDIPENERMTSWQNPPWMKMDFLLKNGRFSSLSFS